MEEHKQVARYHNGSNKPVGKWYSNYLKILLAIAYARIRWNDEYAREAVSTVFEDLIQYKKRERPFRFFAYQPPKNETVKKILSRRVRRRAIDIARPQYRRQLVFVEQEQLVNHAGTTSDDIAPVEEEITYFKMPKAPSIMEQARQILEQQYRNKTAYDYRVFELRYIIGETQVETAALLGISQNQVKVASRRTLRVVRNALKI